MKRGDARELAHRLGQQAEAVCRRYLSSGRRQGNYWQVGNIHNAPGQSLFVRLTDTAKGEAGKWNDAASGEHGDLLDIIAMTCSLSDFREVAEEARRFLSLPQDDPSPSPARSTRPKTSTGSREAARRLYAMAHPITGTLAATYLRGRGITELHGTEALRFHPRCYYRGEDGTQETWPAMIAAVTDLGGKVTGVHRTWLAPQGTTHDGSGKAPISQPRKALGDLNGHAVRFGIAGDALMAGEGIETVLSLRQVLPDMAMAAALSSAHLAAFLLPDTLRRLYILADNDPAGRRAAETLTTRANDLGVEVATLTPQLGDFNEDLLALGRDALRQRIRGQLRDEDVARFLDSPVA